MSTCFVLLYRQTSLEWDAVTEKELVNEKLHCSMLVIAVGQAASGKKKNKKTLKYNHHHQTHIQL